MINRQAYFVLTLKSSAMKKTISLSLLAILLMSAFIAVDEPAPILGRWENKSMYQGSPFSLLVVFRTTGKYDAFANNKIFVSGTYHMKHDTLYISDPTCNSAYEGTYKIQFFGQPDSLKLHVIQDTCTGRREGSNGFVFTKLKSPGK